MSEDRIYHLALADEWSAAVTSGTAYERSTLGVSLAEQGFVHCSFAGQVQRIADLVYRGRTDVVLLAVDPRRLRSEVRVEAPSATGGDEAGGGSRDGDRFPHVYGPLDLEAVVAVTPVPLGADGRLAVDAVLRP
jgi:uncharacterized protein (DUF952 family)